MNNGGPAFPTGTAYQGMSLRDYFAAKAMQGLMDAPMSNAEIADEAYQMADLMIKAREQK